MLVLLGMAFALLTLDIALSRVEGQGLEDEADARFVARLEEEEDGRHAGAYGKW